MTYQLINGFDNNPIGVKTTEGNITMSIPFDPNNTDYQAFLRWCEEGNTPEQAD